MLLDFFHNSLPRRAILPGVLIGACILVLGCLSPLGLFALLGAASLVLLAVLACLYARALPLLVFIGLILGQLARYSLSGDSSSAILLIDFANGLYVAFGLIYLLMAKRRIAITLPLIFLFGYVAWLPISLIFGSTVLQQSETISAFFYIVRFASMAATIVVTASLFSTVKDSQKLVSQFLWAGAILLLLGYAQLIFVPNFAFMAKYGWDPHVGRLLSTFFDPNFFGMFLVMLFSLVLARLFYAQSNGERAWLTLFLVAILVGVAATFSRSTYLALVISLLIIVGIKSWRISFIILLALCLAGSAIPRVRMRVIGALTVDTTAQQRIQSWEDTFQIIRDHPITGVGYNAYGPAQLRYGFVQNLLGRSTRGGDSSLLLTLATTGLVGLTLFLLAYIGFFSEAVLLFRNATSPFWQTISLAYIGLLPAYVVHSQFVNGLYYPLLFIPFALITGIITFGVTQIKRNA